MLCAFAGPLGPFAAPLYEDARRLHEGDERVAEELRGYHKLARTPEPQ
jgi:hypothetical protein